MVVKVIKFCIASFFIFSCATKAPTPVQAEKPKSPPVYSDISTPILSGPLSPVPSENIEPTPLVVVPTILPPTVNPIEAVQNGSETKGVPRIGLIFSGGGAKAWGHIGVIKEIEKAKWPIKAVAGLEWGAVVAAVYAHQLSANETEWELSKIKQLDEPEQASETIFGNRSVNDLKVPFVCSSLNVNKQEIYLLNRGQLNKLIPFCLAHPPLAQAYRQSIAALDDISALAQHLRSTGIKKIILINVLAQNSKRSFTSDYLSAENIIWAKAAAIASRKPQGVDDLVQINLDDYGIKDLDKKRDIIAKAAELSYDIIKKLSMKYGL